MPGYRTRTAGLLFGICISAFSLAGIGAPLSVTSPVTRVDLLELYTSEGCNSCPPADRWVSSLRNDPGLWKTFIPVAFHVDYWDYIGWPDRFASPAFTARQHTYASQESMRVVYTPGFFLNGKEWRWRHQDLHDNRTREAVGVLSLEVEGKTAMVRFENPGEAGDYAVNLALLGFGIETDVGAGENSGKTLTHDFIVLAMRQATLTRGQHHYAATLPVPESGTPADRFALVAWVNQPGDQTPLQAVGGFL